MAPQTSWLGRLPLRWRAAALALTCSRSWRTTIIVVFATAVVGGVATRRYDGFANVLLFYGPPLLAITIFAGLREHLMRGAVWTALFQRPVDEIHELVRILTLCAALYVAGTVLLQGGVLTGLAIGGSVARVEIGYILLTAALWSIVVLFTAAAAGTLATQGAAAMVIAWLISPIAFAMLAQAVGMSDFVKHAFAFVLPPFDAVFGFSKVLRGEQPENMVRYIAQLLTFPLLCVTIIGWRFRAWSRADISPGA